LPNIAAGWFYRWRGDYSDIEFIRAGVGLTYVFDKRHALNVGYFGGWAHAGDDWVLSGIFLVQYVVNIRREWKYIPAKIFTF
jgi:hypothetical protein